MRVRKQTVAEVVAEASAKMNDPNYSSVMVGGFFQDQGPAVQYITAHEQEMGGAEQIINTIFHAALIGICYQRANGRSIRQMTFQDLDDASGGDLAERLEGLQPSIYEYINSNIENPEIRKVLYLISLTMDWVS